MKDLFRSEWCKRGKRSVRGGLIMPRGDKVISLCVLGSTSRVVSPVSVV
jgi:hypothetical protein